MFFDEVVVQGIALEDGFANGAEQGEVSIDLHLEVLGGEGGGFTQHAADFLRVGKSHQAGFLEWVDCNDGAAIFHAGFEGCKHAWVVGPRVLADADDGIGFVDIIQADGALADADGLFHGGAT